MRHRASRAAPLLLALILVSLGLGGCAGPSFVPDPEAGIELRWPNGQGSIDAARAEAEARCAASGRHAVLLMETADRDETLARFACH